MLGSFLLISLLVISHFLKFLSITVMVDVLTLSIYET